MFSKSTEGAGVETISSRLALEPLSGRMCPSARSTCRSDEISRPSPSPAARNSAEPRVQMMRLGVDVRNLYLWVTFKLFSLRSEENMISCKVTVLKGTSKLQSVGWCRHYILMSNLPKLVQFWWPRWSRSMMRPAVALANRCSIKTALRPAWASITTPGTCGPRPRCAWPDWMKGLEPISPRCTSGCLNCPWREMFWPVDLDKSAKDQSGCHQVAVKASK